MTQGLYTFESLWKHAIPAIQRIKEIERGIKTIFIKTLQDNGEINDTIFQIIKESKFLLVCSPIGGIQIFHKYFLDITRKILRAYKAGKHDGIKWVTSINDKNDGNLINLFSKYGMKIRHTSDRPLLQHFLSSHFESHTLENANDDLSYELVEYLSEICKDIVVIKREMAMSKDSLIDGMLPDHLFTWPSANTERKHNYEKFFSKGGNLRQFLSRELGLNWISDAEIKPNFEDDIITIKDSPRGHQVFDKNR